MLDHALADEIGTVDIVVETTEFSPLAFDAMDMVAPNGIVCLTGVSGGSRKLEVPADQPQPGDDAIKQGCLRFCG